MKKKSLINVLGLLKRHRKKLLVMKCCIVFTFFFCVNAAATVYSQTDMISLDLRDVRVEQFLEAVRKQTKICFMYNSSLVRKAGTVTVTVKEKPLGEVLDLVLGKVNLRHEVFNDVILIRSKNDTSSAQQPAERVSGTVKDAAGDPLPGATVLIKEKSRAVMTDADGKYAILMPGSKATLVFSFIGKVTVEVVYTGQSSINVTLEDDLAQIEEVVVTGYFNRTRQSFTGSEVAVRGEELQKLGTTNLLSAISAFDPAVRTIPNNEYGSDLNRVPEITIRGENGFDLRSSADDSRSNPNSPLYILDGIEVSATRVYDLDMNRIEAFSILKDAAATALYGSRGANGVILIQTVTPREGEIRVTLNANYFLSFPDLRDYNLMNAAEKLNYERLAGLYTATWITGATQDELDLRYNFKLAEVARGVDTYWLSYPLQTSVNQRYSAYIEGGDKRFKYGIGVRCDSDKGVMKGSGRERFGANFNFSYNISNKLHIINDISVDNIGSENSPYGVFSSYAQLNPYERVYDPKTGEMIRRFGYGDSKDIVNPLVNSLLPNYDKTTYTEIQDNLSLEWRITDHFLLRGRAGITHNIRKAEAYLSPYSTTFDKTEDEADRGSYTTSYRKQLNFDGNFTAFYNNVFAEKYSLSAGVGANMITMNLNGDGYTATGFLNDKMNFVQYAQGFKKNSVPYGVFDKERLIGFFANVNIGYNNRYFIDASFRTDGSSRFGRESRFAPFWSVGVAWNVDREKWWPIDGSLKIRGSIGSNASTNFAPDQAITKYIYGTSNEYNGYNGAVLAGYGNSALKWQNTLQHNVGFDLSIMQNFLTLNCDFYLNKTQNLLLDIDVAPSTGFLKYKENMGSIRNIGVETRMRFNLIHDRERDLAWSVTLLAAANRNKILKLSNALEAMNEEANKLENVTSATPFRTYQTGRSQSALMVVRSNGIDPATGNEVYVKLNGDLTFDYDPRDKVHIGDTKPKVQGGLQTNISFKGFDLFLLFNYEYGAVIYNATLATKVEGANPYYNVDKRVLYERWKKPGDIVMFRRIDDQSPVYQTSRLVQDNDFINLQTLSLSYTMSASMLKKSFIKRVKFVFSTTDLLRFSTIKMERGTSYPFAQTFSLGTNITF